MAEHVIRLPANGEIGQTKTLAAHLLDALARAQTGDSFVLDASSLKTIDSAMAQLLVSFALETQAEGHPLRFRGVPAGLFLPAALGAEQLDRKTAELLEATRE